MASRLASSSSKPLYAAVGSSLLASTSSLLSENPSNAEAPSSSHERDSMSDSAVIVFSPQQELEAKNRSDAEVLKQASKQAEMDLRQLLTPRTEEGRQGLKLGAEIFKSEAIQKEIHRQIEERKREGFLRLRMKEAENVCDSIATPPSLPLPVSKPLPSAAASWVEMSAMNARERDDGEVEEEEAHSEAQDEEDGEGEGEKEGGESESAEEIQERYRRLMAMEEEARVEAKALLEKYPQLLGSVAAQVEEEEAKEKKKAEKFPSFFDKAKEGSASYKESDFAAGESTSTEDNSANFEDIAKAVVGVLITIAVAYFFGIRRVPRVWKFF